MMINKLCTVMSLVSKNRFETGNLAPELHLTLVLHFLA